MPGKTRTSKFMRRCVADVTSQGRDISSAFAICTAQSQKSGYSKPGSIAMTPKGKIRDKQLGKKKDMKAKEAEFEKALKGEERLTVADILEEYVIMAEG